MKSLLVGLLLMSNFALAEEVKVKVSGMVCSMCAQGIQKKFKDESALEKLDVNLDEKIVTLKIRDGETISDAAITKYITAAGYNVGKIERKK